MVLFFPVRLLETILFFVCASVGTWIPLLYLFSLMNQKINVGSNFIICNLDIFQKQFLVSFLLIVRIVWMNLEIFLFKINSEHIFTLFFQFHASFFKMENLERECFIIVVSIYIM